jgi:predicted dehydrogenase
MKSNRRNFLRLGGLATLGIFNSGFLKGSDQETQGNKFKSTSASRSNNQHFNMCGYAAPKLEVVRVGFIGLGNRGPTHLKNMTKLEGVEIKGVCDIRPENADNAKKMANASGHNPVVYTDNAVAWKKLCDREDVDLIFIATPWEMHTPMALYAMEHGKHVCIEVPAAVTLEECWQLVETSERTRKHCMMMENCCYDFFELLTLNLTRQGFFGEIIHGEGAYIHNLLNENFDKTYYWEMWRLRQNTRRNGNLYPTHGLGPICQIMDINRGDKLNSLESKSSADFMMGPLAEKLAAEDNFYAPYVDAQYRGNMNVTNIRTHRGRTIMIQHDVSSPNIYSRIHKVVGTKGTALKYPLPARISNGGEDWLPEREIKVIEEKYQPAIVKKVGELAKQVGGHGGMDFLMDWRTIDCLHNGLPLDQDVYDAALWSSISPLSEASVANHSMTVEIPDFTKGSWKTNKPVDILLDKGANTKVHL